MEKLWICPEDEKGKIWSRIVINKSLNWLLGYTSVALTSVHLCREVQLLYTWFKSSIKISPPLSSPPFLLSFPLFPYSLLPSSLFYSSLSPPFFFSLSSPPWPSPSFSLYFQHTYFIKKKIKKIYLKNQKKSTIAFRVQKLQGILLADTPPHWPGGCSESTCLHNHWQHKYTIGTHKISSHADLSIFDEQICWHNVLKQLHMTTRLSQEGLNIFVGQRKTC